MVDKPRLVVWSSKAQKELQQAYMYIRKDSLQNADKIKESILEATGKLGVTPEIYAIDKYRIDNDGSFRAFELFRYRVAFKITNDKIIIIRVRHTSRNPLLY